MSKVFRLIPFLFALGVQAQPYLNLDFETATRGQLWYWNAGAAGYTFTVDTTDFQSGQQSLRIQNVSAPATGLGVASQTLPMDQFRGKHVTVSGWIKTANVTSPNGYAAIWWRVDGPNGVISLDNMNQTGPRGTTGWTQYQFSRDIDPNGVDIVFGVFLAGAGTAWFDNLQIQVNGVPLAQGSAPYVGPPTQDMVGWISANAIPITSADPNQGYTDLMPLKNVVGNAHIVGLGEATHGTSEFFNMKHRLVDFLANNMGFTTFAIEANMPEAYRMNDYVLNGNGDPKELLKGMYFWTWNTQEVLDMILWMRQYNASGQGIIQFTGFDMQTPDVAEQIVEPFIATFDPGYANQVANIYTQYQKQQALVQGFGVATGSFPVSVAAGKTLKYTGFIKTQGVTQGYAGLWWRCDSPSGTVFGNTTTATGTHDWQQFEVDLTIPADTTNINFGVLLAGNGEAWFDTLAVSLNGTSYTNNSLFDFDFESPTPVGFGIGGNGYSVRLDPTVAHTGKQSLSMTYLLGSTLSSTEIAEQCAAIAFHMESNRDFYLSQGLNASDVDWATQNARIVAQAADMVNNPGVRDQDMAANIQWIVNQQPPGSKIVLWAHDVHVSRGAGDMGSYLNAVYGKDYVVLGFGFNEGSYNAVGAQGLGPYKADPSFQGSAEYVCLQTGMPQFVLDLRKAAPDNPASAWWLSSTMFRTIGAVPEDGFSIINLVHDYDALIYFEHSSPSTLLPF
jgi:erythromycin esterase-like protein